MKFNKAFSTENILISIAGHLLLVAGMLTSVYIVLEQSKLVVPDRVEILEIDLTKVQITKDETKVFNTKTPEPQKTEPTKTDKPEIPDNIPDKITKPTIVPDTPKDTIKSEPAATKAPTIVRVNRETTSLNRTMTVSVIDALRVAMTRCWVIDQTRPDIADMRVVAHLSMFDNGVVNDLWFESASRADTDAAFAYVVETIRTAINVCQPFNMLPKSEFDEWKEIQLTFYPSAAKIQ